MSAEKIKEENHLQVTVLTTAGVYPSTGSDTVPAHQKVEVELKKAAKALGLVDTSNWVARVGTKEIDVEKNYIDNGLTKEVKIDFGPTEGGGGSHA